MSPLFRRGEGALTLRAASLHQIGAREEQQDSFGLSDLSDRPFCAQKGILAVVADGMGGLSGGAALSQLAVETVLRRFAQTPAADAPAELCDLCAGAAKEAREYLGPKNLGTGGTTLVAALIREGALSFAAVGDSRICLVRGGGLVTLNRPHTYGAQLDALAARGALTVAEARRDPQRHALTSYLGSDEPLLADLSPGPIRLLRGDRVLLMTDGVFGTLTDEEIAAAAAGEAQKAARLLEQKVLSRAKAGQDNFTAIVIACD